MMQVLKHQHVSSGFKAAVLITKGKAARGSTAASSNLNMPLCQFSLL